MWRAVRNDDKPAYKRNQVEALSEMTLNYKVSRL
jgi:hypothetical protein